MKKRVFILFSLIIMCMTPFAPALYGADALYHFTHNSHDALILGQVVAVKDGVCTINVSDTIISYASAKNASPDRLLKPDTVRISVSELHFFSHEDRLPQPEDKVLISVNQVAGDMFTVAHGAFLVSGTDRTDFSVILAKDAPSVSLTVAAAVECFALSGGRVSTFLFYEDIAVGYLMGKSGDRATIVYVYYRGYDKVTPRSPVPGAKLPHPGVDATYEVYKAGK